MTTRKRPSAPHDEITVSKRLRLQHETARREPYTFDSCFSDELVVAIFSYLDYVELCTAQLVNGHWARLATDDQLWKRLFLQDYPSQRLRGSRGFSTRWSAEGGATGREIRPLPARLRVSGQVLWQPWKWMYRIGRNWQQGRCALESLADSGSSDRENTVSPEGYQHNDAPLVLLGGDLTFVASRHLSSSPRVTVHPPSDSPHHLMPSTSSRRDALTCITLDHSIPLEITPELAHTSLDVDFRLVAFLSSGSFSVFSIPPTAPRSYRETHRYTPISNQLDRTSSSELSVQHAAYSHPFLITLPSNPLHHFPHRPYLFHTQQAPINLS
ncbi:hypothetical protein FRC03_001337 [Tulasnella sp. 419]|nr:hypothetical protein FRC03_001337 [Tulasnella sp. 419]